MSENVRSVRGWTDYPILELGDVSGEIAPIRRCVVIKYDGDKYTKALVEGVITEIKRGYIYRRPARCGEAPAISHRTMMRLVSK